MTYVMDLTMLLRTIFHHTRTTNGIVPLSKALINQVLEAYIKQSKRRIRTAINDYVDEMQEFSSEDAAHKIRELMEGNRFEFEVDVSIPQTSDDAVDETQRSTSFVPAGYV